MSRNFAIFLLCLATLSAFGWGLHEHRQVRRLRQEQARLADQRIQAENEALAELRTRLLRQERSADAMRRNYESRLAQSRNRGGAQPVAPAQPGVNKLIQSLKSGFNANALTSTSQGQEADTPAKSFMGEIAKSLKNPEMKKMMVAQQKAMMDMTYGSLYGMLNLPEGQLAAFKDLLAKRQMDLTDIGLDMLDTSMPAERKKEIQNQIKTLTAQANKEIETLLGKENYAVYKAYEETQAERMAVRMFNQGMTSDQQLSEIQENDLVFEMHKARSDFKFTKDLQKQNGEFDPSTLTPEVMEKFLAESRRLNEQYLEIAGRMLTPAQLESFRASLKNQQAMQEFGLKIVSGMSSGGVKAVPTPPLTKTK